MTERVDLHPTGNWADYVQKTSGTTVLDQDREHNMVNEIDTDEVHGDADNPITESTGTAWADPVHDAAGNMTTVPWPVSLANGLTLKYDAWNRLVEVKYGANVIAAHEYDGLNRRTIEAPTFGSTYYLHNFYNSSWQMLEMRCATTPNAQPESVGVSFQYVWSARYVDAPVLREYAGTRYYFLGDANFNVTTLLDTSGDAREHYHYDPYGKVRVLNGATPDSDGAEWTADPGNSSDVENHQLYTGRWQDYRTGLYHYRHRYYHAELGRFLSRDPIGYDADDENLYRYAANRPLAYVDPWGLWGTDIHRDLTTFLASVAGIGCPEAFGGGANRPDEDLRGPFIGNLRALINKILALPAGVVPSVRRRLLREARETLQTMLDYHFPLSEKGVVEPGSFVARRLVDVGLVQCNPKMFSEGLHPFQDSYSHQGKPAFGEMGGHAGGVFTIPDVIATLDSVLKGNVEIRTLDIQLRGLLAGISKSADEAKNRPATLRTMALETFKYLREFRKKCGRCLCPDKKTRVDDGFVEWTEEMVADELERRWPGGDRIRR